MLDDLRARLWNTRWLDPALGGGITLISATADVSFRSLGRHRLPGLAAARTLFQVEADGLSKDFPPLRTGVAD